MQATGEATEVISVEKLRDRALDALANDHGLRIEEELEQIKQATSYAELLLLTQALVSAYDLHNFMHGPLKAVCRDVVKQLTRIEKEHASLTSLASLRDRVAGIVKVYGPMESDELLVGLWETSSYGELDKVIVRIATHLRSHGYEKATYQLAEIRALIESQPSSSD